MCSFTSMMRVRLTRRLEGDEMTKKWNGSKPVKCDICSEEFLGEKFFIDGRTIYGPWGMMCERCHKLYGTGLGLGNGQKYGVETLVKVEG